MATMSSENIEFLALRTLELMGGREKAIALMEAEYYAMKERWNQDTQMIGRILRSHLHVEYYLTEHLQHTNPGLGDLDDARLNFSQKLSLLKSDGGIIDMIVGGVRHLNKIRNRLAHNLASVVTEEDAKVFLSQGIFKAMRDESAKSSKTQPDLDPLSVLEEFAEFASSMLHNSTTQYSKSFQQAMSELSSRTKPGCGGVFEMARNQGSGKFGPMVREARFQAGSRQIGPKKTSRGVWHKNGKNLSD